MRPKRYKVENNFLRVPSKKQNTKIIRKKQHNYSFTKIIIGLIGICLVVGLIIFIFISGVFNISNYEISGNQNTTQADIINTIMAKTKSKLIFSVDPISIEQDIKNKFPIITSVRVTKQIPSTILIDIKERNLAFVIKTLDNYVLISDQGYVAQAISETEYSTGKYKQYKKISLIDEPARQVGYNFDAKLITKILNFENTWIKDNLLPYMDILIDKDNNLRVVLNNGSIIIFTLENDLSWDDIIYAAKNVYANLSKGKKIKTLDMRFDKIAVTYV